MSGIVEDIWILIFASTFNLLWCIDMAEVYLTLYKYIVEKLGILSCPFSDNCDYCFFDAKLKLNKWRFLES